MGTRPQKHRLSCPHTPHLWPRHVLLWVGEGALRFSGFF